MNALKVLLAFKVIKQTNLLVYPPFHKPLNIYEHFKRIYNRDENIVHLSVFPNFCVCWHFLFLIFFLFCSVCGCWTKPLPLYFILSSSLSLHSSSSSERARSNFCSARLTLIRLVLFFLFSFLFLGLFSSILFI